MPLKKQDQQVRSVVIGKDGRIKKYTVIRGEMWRSGYDERAADTITDLHLTPGRYRVSFYPVGLAKGWDSITRLKYELMPHSKNTISRCKR